MKELLLEIGAEEIPSDLVSFGIRKLEELTARLLKENRLEFEGIKAYGTPRRLILHVSKLSEKQAEASEEIIGPPKKISFDEQGKLTPAGLRFAQAQGVLPEELKVKLTPKGEYLAALKKKIQLRSFILLKTLLPNLIQSMSFPKSMIWSPSKIRFVRPIRWIVALYGGKPVSFKVGEIRSGVVSYGHRFLGPKPIRAKNLASFEKQLRKQYVIIDPNERRKIIQKDAMQLGRSCGGKAEISDEILEQAVNMVEYPVVFRGGFEEKFLKLPKEIIINAMCEHQGYFPVFAPPGDHLLPYFVAVSNMKTRQMKLIQRGNERVLRSRLSDAQFYFDLDLKTGLSDRIEDLKKVVYQENLGSQYERIGRLELLCGQLAAWIKPDDPKFQEMAKRAGRLSKADLLTGVVREFPKLQGIMGREYALRHRKPEPKEVADALSEQYLPRFAGDVLLPKSKIGKILSIADKIDAITGCFGVGLIPTGSEDPYGLRRQGAGLIQIILTFEPTSLVKVRDLIEQAVLHYEVKQKLAVDVRKKITEFLKQRYEFILASEKYRPDIIQAVIAVEFDDLVLARKRIHTLTDFIKNPKFYSLIIAYKRMNNIIPKGFVSEPYVNTDLIASEGKELYQLISEKKEVKQNLFSQNRYQAVLELFAGLKEPIDRFFNAVLVNDPDESVRKNRLTLVKECLNFFKSFADFSKIVTES